MKGFHNNYYSTSYPGHKDTLYRHGPYININGIDINVSGYEAVIPSRTKTVKYKVSGLSGTTLRTVDGTSFLCTKPAQGRLPSNTGEIKHMIVQDASMCQLECMEAGKQNCNVYSYEVSDFAPNCTLGVNPSFAEPLLSTTDPSNVAGYCVAVSDAVTSVWYPPQY